MFKYEAKCWHCGVKAVIKDDFFDSGKPRSSYYFIGHNGDYLIYLDPHYTQPGNKEYY